MAKARRQAVLDPNEESRPGLGAFLRRRRAELGLTQEGVSDAAGIGRSHLSQIESGKIGLPNAGIRRKLAAALELRHVDLLIAAGELDEAEVREGRQAPASELDRLTADIDDDGRAALLTVARMMVR